MACEVQGIRAVISDQVSVGCRAGKDDTSGITPSICPSQISPSVPNLLIVPLESFVCYSHIFQNKVKVHKIFEEELLLAF